MRLFMFGSVAMVMSLCHVGVAATANTGEVVEAASEFEKPKSIDRSVRIFLAGDSTMAPYSQKRYPLTGWGQCLEGFFTDTVGVSNHAVGGRSSKSFIDEGRWKKIKKQLRAGDYVFVQFGHNDQKPDTARHTDPDTTYKTYLKTYIDETRAKGANPVIITSVYRRIWRKGELRDSLGDYPRAAREVAKEENVPLIDLHAKSGAYFTSLGVEGSKKAFNWVEPGQYPAYPDGRQDNSHFNNKGADAVAALVVEEIQRLDLPVAKQVKASPEDIKRIKELK